MEKNVAAGKTPSSLPMSTPPPVALQVSPKLSPVHTKSSLNSKPELGRSDMQSSFPEDNDVGPVSLRSMSNHSDIRHPGEDWNDRYSSGGTLYLLLSDIFILSICRLFSDSKNQNSYSSDCGDIGCNQGTNEKHSSCSSCRKHRQWKPAIEFHEWQHNPWIAGSAFTWIRSR